MWPSRNRQTSVVAGIQYTTAREAHDGFERATAVSEFDAKTRGWSDFSVFVCISRGSMNNVFW